MPNSIIRNERVVDVFGVEFRAFNVVAADNGRILNQEMKASRDAIIDGKPGRIVVSIRFDDRCNNGHEDFSIVASIDREVRPKVYGEYMGGCCHEEIVKHFPELEPLVKWHLCGVDGPMHYPANAIYHAGDRDCNGLRKGEQRQIRNGRSGELCWILAPVDGRKLHEVEKYVDGPEAPEAPEIRYVPWMRVGEGKERDLDAARSCAVWPDASDEELMVERDVLRAALMARLPKLLEDFKADMVKAGFVWPERKEVSDAEQSA